MTGPERRLGPRITIGKQYFQRAPGRTGSGDGLQARLEPVINDCNRSRTVNGLEDLAAIRSLRWSIPSKGHRREAKLLKSRPACAGSACPALSLNHINLWTIDDGEGWAIVDTGVRNEETVRLARAVRQAPDQRPLTRIFVTHMHPDHVGMAGWLIRKFEFAVDDAARVLKLQGHGLGHRPRGASDAIEFCQRAVEPRRAETYRARFGTSEKDSRLAGSYRR